MPARLTRVKRSSATRSAVDLAERQATSRRSRSPGTSSTSMAGAIESFPRCPHPATGCSERVC